jgi:hypothetical protein
MVDNRGEVKEGLAHIESVDILRIWKVFGPVITVRS